MKRNTLFFVCIIFFISIISSAKANELASNANLNFLAEDFTQATSATTTTQEKVADAATAFSNLEKSGNYTDVINTENLTQLPIGIRESRNSVEYGIVITKVEFTPEYAKFNVYARVVMPQKGDAGKKMLYFGAEGVKLSYNGGIIGDAKLSLLGDVSIPFNSGNWILILIGGTIKTNTGVSKNENTYATIDCDGLKELSLKGIVQISKKLIVPVDTQGVADTTSYVTGAFSAKATDWNDMILDVSIPNFAITEQTKNQDKGYFSFSVANVVLDMSDTRNSTAMTFPKTYLQKGYLVAGKETWRGLFVKDISVRLPEEIKSSAKKAISFEAQNMIVDGYGVSGAFSASNILPLKEGITSSEAAWGFSIDKIGIELEANRLVGGNINGEILLPIQVGDESTTVTNDSTQFGLKYKGKFTEDEYLLSVATETNLPFNVWSAKAVIESGSSVELLVKNKRFYPKAVLSGYMNIATREKDKTDTSKTGQLNDIEFQELALQTIYPYVSVKYFGAKGEHRIANFPVSINNIKLYAVGNRADLGFDITVGFQDKGFSASGNFLIEGKISSENSRQNWKYEGFSISKLVLNDVDIKIANISGGLELMKNDPLYGNGFHGMLFADITGGVKVKVDACFGRSTYRYWGFQGLVDNLTIMTPTGLTISGFVGGAFYHMLPDGDLSARNKNAGLVFKPDNTVGLALRAGIYGYVGTESAASIMASFNINTNSNGGLANIGFLGEAYVMANLSSVFPNPFSELQDKFTQVVDKIGEDETLNKLANNDRINAFLDVSDVDKKFPTSIPSSEIYGKLAMNYDFNNDIFHANLDVYVNTPGNVITGVGSGGCAGSAVLHIASKKDWYLHIGTPNDMIGLKMGLGKIYIESKSYFMVGTNIPASPAPPVEVANILGVQLDDIDYMKNLNSLGTGSGFAFGTHFKFDTGDMRCLMLYARFAAGLGADIMLKNYGKASCDNTGGDLIGINGWYANGQMYAYLQGELGIKIKLFFVKKKIPIIKAGAAALLQAQGPNPFWISGYLGGYYSLLGGMVHGKYRFKMEFGKQCELADQDEVLGGMKIISDLTPANNEEDVNVFAIPQATFNLKVNEPITLAEDDGDHIYKVLIDKFTILDENGEEVTGKYEVEDSKDVADFVSEDILTPNKKMTAVVEVSFLEKKNGVYEVVTVDGQKATEREEREFTTGTAPTSIPLTNIEYAYPVVDQENMYREETAKGYIRLKRGQDYLFDDENWTTVTQFTDADGNAVASDFAYFVADNEVTFSIPDLDKEKEYAFSISAETSGSESTTIATTTNTVQSEADSTTIETTSKETQSISKDGSIERLTYDFRTSKYNTLKEKINKLNLNTLDGYICSGLVFLQNNAPSNEYFDKTELVGSQYTGNKPLIEVTATMDDAFADKFKQLIYNNYLVEGITLSRASNDSVGIPPVDAMPISNEYLTWITSDKSNPFLKSVFPYKYDLFRYYRNDWYEIVSKATEKKIAGDNSTKLLELMQSSFGIIPNGKYKANIKYVMPGDKSGTEKEIGYTH